MKTTTTLLPTGVKVSHKREGRIQVVQNNNYNEIFDNPILKNSKEFSHWIDETLRDLFISIHPKQF